MERLCSKNLDRIFLLVRKIEIIIIFLFILSRRINLLFLIYLLYIVRYVYKMQNVSITLQRILRSVVDKGGSPVNINQLLLIIRRTEDKQCNCTSRKNFSKSIIITSSNYFKYSRVFPGRRSRQQLSLR